MAVNIIRGIASASSTSSSNNQSNSHSSGKEAPSALNLSTAAARAVPQVVSEAVVSTIRSSKVVSASQTLRDHQSAQEKASEVAETIRATADDGDAAHGDRSDDSPT